MSSRSETFVEKRILNTLYENPLISFTGLLSILGHEHNTQALSAALFNLRRSGQVGTRYPTRNHQVFFVLDSKFVARDLPPLPSKPIDTEPVPLRVTKTHRTTGRKISCTCGKCKRCIHRVRVQGYRKQRLQEEQNITDMNNFLIFCEEMNLFPSPPSSLNPNIWIAHGPRAHGTMMMRSRLGAVKGSFGSSAC